MKPRTKSRPKRTPSLTRAETAQLLIEKAGGVNKFGQLLGITGNEFWRQRVTNWRTRGIPLSVQLSHLDTLAKLSERSGAA